MHPRGTSSEFRLICVWHLGSCRVVTDVGWHSQELVTTTDRGSRVQTGFLLPHRYATFVCVVNNLYTFTLTAMQTPNGKTGNSLCLDGVKSEQVADALSPLLSTRTSTLGVWKEWSKVWTLSVVRNPLCFSYVYVKFCLIQMCVIVHPDSIPLSPVI